MKNEDLLTEITIRIEHLSALDKKLIAKKKGINDKAKKIWDSTLTPDTVAELNDNVLDLERLYTGSDSDVEDFRVMKNIVQMYSELMRQLHSLCIGFDDFKAQCQTTKKDFLDRFSEIESPWGLEEAFNELETFCIAKRNQAMHNWIDSMSARALSLEKMTSSQANELLRTLCNPPCYVNAEQNSIKLDALREKVEKHLNNKEIEWLIARFKQLPLDAQKEFIRLCQQSRTI